MDASMCGLIEELFDTMDHPSALAALQQQVDKDDLDAMLFLGLYYMYISLDFQPEKAFYYFDLAAERHQQQQGKLIRALYEDSQERVLVDGESFGWVVIQLHDMVDNCSWLVVQHLVRLAKVYGVSFDAKPLLKRLRKEFKQLKDDELYEARLLYAELLSMEQLNSYDRTKAIRAWESILNFYPKLETVQRAFRMHTRKRDGLLSDDFLRSLFDRMEAEGNGAFLYKGYWLLCSGQLAEAYRCFERGYVLGEYQCDLALAYCLFHGYGTSSDRERALQLCAFRASTDPEAALLRDRFLLFGSGEGRDQASHDLFEQALSQERPEAISELILQDHRAHPDIRACRVFAHVAVCRGLETRLPLAYTYCFLVNDDYGTEGVPDIRGSQWLFTAESYGSHPLTDYQLAVYNKGVMDYEESATYYIRLLHCPDVSLRFRKEIVRELVAYFAYLSDGAFFDQALEWWNRLDWYTSDYEHQALVQYREVVRLGLDNPMARDYVLAIRALCEIGEEVDPFIYFLAGCCCSESGPFYDPDKAERYLSIASERGCYVASEKLWLDSLSSSWTGYKAVDRDLIEERMDSAENPHRLNWAISEMAGYAFPRI